MPGSKDFTIKLEDKGGDKATVAKASAEKDVEQDDNLWIFFWMAFGSGLLAVVMPCVFPMIPMTVSFFMHLRHHRPLSGRLRRADGGALPV